MRDREHGGRRGVWHVGVVCVPSKDRLVVTSYPGPAHTKSLGRRLGLVAVRAVTNLEYGSMGEWGASSGAQ